MDILPVLWQKDRKDLTMGSFIKSKEVKIRKSHKCWGCGRLFHIGTLMESNTSTDNGKIFTTYLCETCQNVIDKYADWYEEEGFGYMELINNYPDEYKTI